MLPCVQMTGNVLLRKLTTFSLTALRSLSGFPGWRSRPALDARPCSPVRSRDIMMHKCSHWWLLATLDDPGPL